MKQLFTLLALTFLTTTFGQTADEYLKSGVEKHNAKDLEGAIKDYTKAIKLDKNLTNAYFNRGMCEQALKNYKDAYKDFEITTTLDPKLASAFYCKATVLVAQEKYKEAIPDLDKTIELELKTPNALTLRGQVRAQLGDKTGACEDFNKAKNIDDKNAEKLLSDYCGNKQQDGESFSLHWPESENWKIGSNQEDDKMTMLELIHSNETFENWTEIGTCIAYKNATNVPCDAAMNMMYEQAKKESPKAKLTFIEKDEKAEFPWIIFTIECPNFKNDNKPESQLWYIIQGKTSLYSNFRAIKKSSIPNDLKEKWIAFFKSGKMIYQ
ncbi:MAG TPA: tetratricopeptide repeat protein [Flavobacterium sp.]